jgi:transformation/transcription domain-associated protein
LFLVLDKNTHHSCYYQVLEHFAAVFTLVSPAIFQDVFSLHITFLFDSMVENNAMLAIPQHFLANPGVSRIFAGTIVLSSPHSNDHTYVIIGTDILLNFLMERLKSLSGLDKVASSVLLRLFKLVFGSVTLILENEIVLQPYLSAIVTSAMKYASEVKESLNYFVLLRALFRSIKGGKFDLLMKEFLPLLPGMCIP